MPGPKRAYTDEQLLADALLHPNRKAWETAGDAERAAGTPSHYDAANKRGSDFMARCTAHMTRAPKTQPRIHDDAMLRAAALKFRTLNDWKHGDPGSYQAREPAAPAIQA